MADEEGGDEALKFMEEQAKKKEEKLQDDMDEYEESRKKEKQAMEDDIAELKRKRLERAKEREEYEKKVAATRREEEARRKQEEEERKKRKALEEEKRKKERERKRRENERLKAKSKGPNFTIVKKEGGAKKDEEEEKEKKPQKTKEQLEKEKQAAIATRITPLNEGVEGDEALAEYAKDLHNQIRNLVSNMYNLEDTCKRLQYDIVELQERARAMSKTKKKGVSSVQYDDSYDRMNDRFSNAPPKVLLCSKYERHTDGRSFGERHKLYEELTATVQAELAREQSIRGGIIENGDVADDVSLDTVDTVDTADE